MIQVDLMTVVTVSDVQSYDGAVSRPWCLEGGAGNGISATRIADAVDEQRIDRPEQVFDGGSQIGAVQ